MIEIKDVELELGGKRLFEKVNLSIIGSEKIGLVGVNGSGKSTLLKCIVGEIEPDRGKISIKGSYAYLAQETHKEVDINLAKGENFGNPLQMSIEEYLVLHNGIDVEPWEIQKLMNQMNMVGQTVDVKLADLSGGQKVKVDIIKLLLQKPDHLILDEPTNFLDIPTAEWLMRYLVGYENSVIVVSHDLRLMNKALNKIWYLNEKTHQISVYSGNYDKFIELKSKQEEWLVKQISLEEKRAKALLESANVLSGRTSTKEKQKAAKKRGLAIQVAKEAKEMGQTLTQSKKMNLKFNISIQPSKNILSVKSISKSYKSPILQNITFELFRGERLVLLGRNGVGKTTLLKVLTGKTEPDRGEVKWGHNVDVGYYAQEYEGLDYNSTLLENMLTEPRIKEEGDSFARKILGAFLFSGDSVNKQVKVLSGGEKTRLAMAKVMASGYNTLILDEPTTYLDPKSIQILLQALIDYKGTIILVSHEPEFVAKLKPDKVLLLPEERFTYYTEEYIDRVRKV